MVPQAGQPGSEEWLPWGGDPLEEPTGDEVMASEDGEVGESAIFSSFPHGPFPPPGGVGRGQAQAAAGRGYFSIVT